MMTYGFLAVVRSSRYERRKSWKNGWECLASSRCPLKAKLWCDLSSLCCLQDLNAGLGRAKRPHHFHIVMFVFSSQYSWFFFSRLFICMQKLHECSAHEVRLLKVSEELILVISYLSCTLPLEFFFFSKCSHVLGCFRLVIRATL